MYYAECYINLEERKMAFKKVQGKTKFMWFPVTPSTVLTKGDLVAMNVGSNLLIEATATTNNSIIIGTIRHSIAATDDNYAVARNVEVEVPVDKNVVWSCDEVGTGTAAAADVGTYADITGGGEINVDASTYDVFFITKVVSQTDVRGVLNIGPECLGTIAD